MQFSNVKNDVFCKQIEEWITIKIKHFQSWNVPGYSTNITEGILGLI